MVQLTVKQSGTAVTNKVYIGTTHVPIQAAIDYANSQGGGTIFIEKGVYLINNTANTGSSSGGGKWGLKLYSNIKLAGEYYGTVLKPAFANDSNACIISCIGTSAVRLENITIEALAIGNDTNTQIGGKGISVEYCGLSQTTGLSSGGYDPATVGKDKPNKTGITVRNCVVQNNSNNGIYLVSSSNSAVTANTVQNNRYNGIYLVSSPNNTITGNTVQNNESYGIHLSSSPNSAVTANTVQNNNGYGVYFISPGNSTVTANTVQNNNSGGIRLDSSPNNTVIANTVRKNTTDGIYLNISSNNNTVTGNIYNTISIGGSGNINNATHNQQVT